MSIRRKFVEVKERVETKYVHYLDENGNEVKILDSAMDKIPDGCRIVKWTREQEMKTYRMPIEEFMACAITED